MDRLSVRGCRLTYAIGIGVFLLMLLFPAAANGDTPHRATTPVLANVTTVGEFVQFGSYAGKPLQWQVTQVEDGNSATLLLAHPLEYRYYDEKYDSDLGYFHQNWSGSDICEWLNSTGDYGFGGSQEGFYSQAFSEVEKSRILIYGSEEKASPSWDLSPRQSFESPIIKINQKVVLPSIEEVQDGGSFGFQGDKRRRFYFEETNDTDEWGEEWWLRSPGDRYGIASSVLADGSIGTDVHPTGPASHGYSGAFVRPVVRVSLGKLFVPKIHGNSFVHRSALPAHGFYGVSSYKISKSFMEKLVSQAGSKGERALLKEIAASPWQGSCYGISTTMALAYNGRLDLSRISGNPSVKTYYRMPQPKQNALFRDTINYYQLSQFIKNDYRQGRSVYSGFRFLWWNTTPDLDLFLKDFVSVCQDGSIVPFSYRSDDSDSGHLVLATGVRKTDSGYDIDIYDMNTVDYYGDIGMLSKMKISKDFKSFELPTTHYTLNERNYSFMRFQDINVIDRYIEDPVTSPMSRDRSLNISNLEPSQSSFEIDVIVPYDSKYTLTNEKGQYLSYDGSNYKGDLPINNIETYVGDNNRSFIRYTMQSSPMVSIVFEDVSNQASFITEKGLVSFSGTGVESAILTDSGLILNGSRMEFASTHSVVGSEDPIAVRASCDSQVLLSVSDASLLVSAHDSVSNLWVGKYTTDGAKNLNIESPEIDVSVPDSVKVKVSYSSGGSGTGSGVYLLNDLITLQSKASRGYRFTGWYEGSSKIGSLPNMNLIAQKNMSLKGVFKPIMVKTVKPVGRQTKTITKGKRLQLRASVLPSSALDRTVSWRSTNSRVVRVSQTGKAVGVRRGSAYIVMKARDGSGKYARYKIVVK